MNYKFAFGLFFSLFLKLQFGKFRSEIGSVYALDVLNGCLVTKSVSLPARLQFALKFWLV